MKTIYDGKEVNLPVGEPDRDNLLGLVRSIQLVAIQGIKSGQEIAEMKYQPLLEAAKALIAEARATDLISSYESFIALKKSIERAEV